MSDIERAIRYFEGQKLYYDDREAYQDDFRFCCLAISALEDQLKRETDTSTIDQLKQMMGISKKGGIENGNHINKTRLT